MKKIVSIILFCLFACAGLTVRATEPPLVISNLKIEEIDSLVYVSFDGQVPDNTVKRQYSLFISPVLADTGMSSSSYMVSLPVIVVEGRGMRVSKSRVELASGLSPEIQNAVYTANGGKFHYSATVTAQEWMHGAKLFFEEALMGCCSILHREDRLVASNLRLREEVPVIVEMVPEVIEVPADVFVPVSLADTLSLSFPFVADASEFDENEPFRIYDDERENALIVYFSQGGSAINPQYRGNEQILINLTTVVTMIRKDPKSEVEKIIIGGFASPEGSYEVNDRLAFERAVSVKEHVIKTTGMPDQDILIYNGSVDWRGLRYMISKTNILERDDILRIIDEVPAWDVKNNRGRLGELMRLNNGATYRFLLSEYFPLLRNGAFIKVYYKNN